MKRTLALAFKDWWQGRLALIFFVICSMVFIRKVQPLIPAPPILFDGVIVIACISLILIGVQAILRIAIVRLTGEAPKLDRK